MTAKLTIGPILFHWSAEKKRDFYARIADDEAVDTVYLGEVICSKRQPFFDQHIAEIAERLERGGKRVVISSVAEVMLKRERRGLEDLVREEEHEIEVNNSAALFHMDGRKHRIGQYFNTYNEETMAYLVARGASHVSLPAEMPRGAVAVMAERAARLGIGLEVQVFGRASLALSARCYHARAHGRIKDNCQFVCEEDPDGMSLKTLSGQDFLKVNGIQTLSNSYVNLLPEMDEMRAMGVSHFRLVPQEVDMVAVAQVFRDVLDGRAGSGEGLAWLEGMKMPAAFSNGFWYGKAGFTRNKAA